MASKQVSFADEITRIDDDDEKKPLLDRTQSVINFFGLIL